MFMAFFWSTAVANMKFISKDLFYYTRELSSDISTMISAFFLNFKAFLSRGLKEAAEKLFY